ncbi:hypothetical protein HispidOSU_023390, partial [Sigmodon hispidus]
GWPKEILLIDLIVTPIGLFSLKRDEFSRRSEEKAKNSTIPVFWDLPMIQDT